MSSIIQELGLDALKEVQLVSIDSLKKFIAQYWITEQDTLLINQSDWDNLALEYRATFDQPLTVPFFLDGILIEEAPRSTLSRCTIGLIKGDWQRREAYAKAAQEALKPKRETVYRCGYCGAMVDADGEPLTSSERARLSEVWQIYGDDVLEKTHGKCCVEKYNGQNKNRKSMREVIFVTGQEILKDESTARKGKFHQFGSVALTTGDGQTLTETKAFIEDDETGRVYQVHSHQFRFLTAKEISEFVHKMFYGEKI